MARCEISDIFFALGGVLMLYKTGVIGLMVYILQNMTYPLILVVIVSVILLQNR